MTRALQEFATGLYVQTNVIHALILRETKTRFGKYQLGYLWALLEPIMWMSLFFLMFLFGGRVAPNGMDFVGFMATGMCPFLLFRQTTNQLTRAVSGNKALLFYPQVFPLDLLIARGTLEAASISVVFLLIMGGNAVFGAGTAPAHPVHVITGFAMASLLGAALGTTLHAATLYFPSVENYMSSVLRLMFWVSGIFFTSTELPTQAAALLWWNPALHIVEIVRSGWYGAYHPTIADPGYVLYWMLGFGFIGLTLERISRRRIEL